MRMVLPTGDLRLQYTSVSGSASLRYDKHLFASAALIK
jgi:hypothetical protein